MSDVELEMNETFWEYENIACLKYFGEEFVLHSWCWIRKDKSNIEGAFQDCEDFSCTRVGGCTPAALESLTATQKSCKGLGSDASANEDANAKTAVARISNLTTIFN
nr:hypothetical protein CKAN_01463300 [Ipomoea batatas]